MSTPTLTHIAGPMEYGVQKCARCGEELLDMSGDSDSDIEGGERETGFTEGRSVVKGSNIPFPPDALDEPPPMCEFRRKVLA